MSAWFIHFFALLSLMSVSMNNGQEYPAKTTTKGYPTSTTTTTNGYPISTITIPEYITPTVSSPSICYGPNTTVANFNCQCQPLCGYGTLCDNSVECSFLKSAPCVCAELTISSSLQYVLDPLNLNRCVHASECQCKAPNEEFKTCMPCEPTCANPSFTCQPYCSAATARCVCKDGYLRNKIGTCVAINSDECAMERTTTPPPTTTPYHERIHCYNGSVLVADCSWYKNTNSEDYKKCVEYQKRRENDAFQPILCNQGVTQCYELHHNCHTSDVTKYMKGCGNTWSTPSYGICDQLRWGECGQDGNSSTYNCATCEGDLCNKGEIPRISTTTQKSTTPTTSAPPICHGPNMTVANYSCQCQPVCGYGYVCPTSCNYLSALTCVCAEHYVLDPLNLNRCMHESECQCKAPNEEFKTCTGCDPTCANPSLNCTPYCNAYSSRCVCKDGYLRNKFGVCVPKNSYECASELPTTTTPTTTPYHARIHCYNGTLYVTDCSLYTDINSEDYKKCVEYQEKQEKDAFQPILCEQSVTECYDLRHNCHLADVTKLVKGCGYIWNTPTYGVCNPLRYSECGRFVADGSMFDCADCEGNLCNKGEIPRTTTITYSSPPIYTTSAAKYSTLMTTNATTKGYHI